MNTSRSTLFSASLLLVFNATVASKEIINNLQRTYDFSLLDILQSMNDSPIIFIDEDEDDQLLFQRALTELGVSHPIVFFSRGQAALDYLAATADIPFLIISEIGLPGMSGIELRQQLEQDLALRKKSTPFIFMTYPVVEQLVEQAYQLTIQGLFEKKTGFDDWKMQLNDIIRYWTECRHSKRFDQ